MSGSFLAMTRDLQAGATLSELDTAIADVVNAVGETRKKGEITLRITIRPPKSGSSSYLTVEADVNVKMPTNDRPETVFFPLADGSLSRSDPSQMPLIPRGVVDRQTGEVVERDKSQASGGSQQ